MLKVTQYGEVTRFDLARSISGRGRYWTTCYKVGDTLIDSGCAHTREELQHALGKTSLARIVNSHTHEDHIGANGLLQSHNDGLEILAHPLALPVLVNPRHAQPLHPYRQFFWGWPTSSNAQAVMDGELIETENYRFRVVYTPGHNEDHICLYEENRGWLFSGDLFNGGRDRAVVAGSDIWEIIASLKRVASLPIETLFPGSSRVRLKPKEELINKITYLEELGENVLRLHSRGYSVNEIRNALLGGRMWIEAVTIGHFTRRRLVLSYLGLNDQ